jgi:diguanylate cyclase (GGDEF)-like protein
MQKLLHHSVLNPEDPTTVPVSAPEHFEGPHDRQSVLVGAKVMKLLIDTQEEARTDALTGLPNRRGFDESVDHLIEKISKNQDQDVSFLFIDLDNFKEVNDNHPDQHEAGDLVLKSVADILSYSIKPREEYGEGIGRVGGDEFAAVITTAKTGNKRRTPNKGIGEVEAGYVERVEKEVKQLADKIGMPSLGVSIGIVRYEKGETAEQFRKRADAEMYKMKKAKKLEAQV